MSVRVINLRKEFGDQIAVNSINFEIGEGEIVGFLGPNGAGKSTTMKMLTGFLPPTSGESWVAGYNVARNPLEVKRTIGYLPEHNPLYLDIYVKEYLLFCAGIFKLPKKEERVKDIIEKVGLSPEYKKKIGQLSKGYRQRVGLAQALIHDPKVLVLDEPTSGLDPNQIVEIRNVIKEFGKDKTVILSTHIMQEALALCNKVIIINKGVIVANDNVQNLQNTAKTKTIIIVQLNKEIDLKLLQVVPGVINAKRVGANKYQLECTSDIREQLFFAIAPSGSAIINMQLEQQSLEEIFKALTNPNLIP